VNSLISLAIARVSADGSEDGRYAGFYRRLVAEGYVEATHWAHFDPMRFGRRTNEHMAYLALYALLLLTHDPATLERLGSGEQRTWNHVRGEHNAFFAFVHAMRGVKTGDGPGRSGEVMEAAAEGREALFEFPDDKIEWPVDLTREGFDVPRSWLNTNKGFPRSRVAIPLHLRPRTSSFWGGNPYQMAGCLSPGGRVESAGVDFLLAYWMGRYHGFLKPGD
jgi:hypothetical protein